MEQTVQTEPYLQTRTGENLESTISKYIGERYNGNIKKALAEYRLLFRKYNTEPFSSVRINGEVVPAGIFLPHLAKAIEQTSNVKILDVQRKTLARHKTTRSDGMKPIFVYEESNNPKHHEKNPVTYLLREIGKYRLLTKEDEVKLGNRVGSYLRHKRAFDSVSKCIELIREITEPSSKYLEAQTYLNRLRITHGLGSGFQLPPEYKKTFRNVAMLAAYRRKIKSIRNREIEESDKSSESRFSERSSLQRCVENLGEIKELAERCREIQYQLCEYKKKHKLGKCKPEVMFASPRNIADVLADYLHAIQRISGEGNEKANKRHIKSLEKKLQLLSGVTELNLQCKFIQNNLRELKELGELGNCRPETMYDSSQPTEKVVQQYATKLQSLEHALQSTEGSYEEGVSSIQESTERINHILPSLRQYNEVQKQINQLRKRLKLPKNFKMPRKFIFKNGMLDIGGFVRELNDAIKKVNMAEAREIQRYIQYLSNIATVKFSAISLQEKLIELKEKGILSGKCEPSKIFEGPRSPESVLAQYAQYLSEKGKQALSIADYTSKRQKTSELVTEASNHIKYLKSGLRKYEKIRLVVNKTAKKLDLPRECRLPKKYNPLSAAERLEKIKETLNSELERRTGKEQISPVLLHSEAHKCEANLVSLITALKNYENLKFGLNGARKRHGLPTEYKMPRKFRLKGGVVNADRLRSELEKILEQQQDQIYVSQGERKDKIDELNTGIGYLAMLLAPKRRYTVIKRKLLKVQKQNKILKTYRIPETYLDITERFGSLMSLNSALEKLKEKYEEKMKDGWQAREDFICANLRLVFHVAKNWYRGQMDLLDKFQEGCIGLITAVDRWDPDRNLKFSTYATWWIRQAISRSILNNAKTIRIPVHVYDHISRINKAEQAYTMFGKEIDENEIAATLNIPVSALRRFKQLPSTTSIDAPVKEDSDTKLQDILRIKSKEELGGRNRLENTYLFLLLRNSKVKEFYKEIATQRWGISGTRPKTLGEVGERYDLTRERIRQIEKKVKLSVAKVARRIPFKEFARVYEYQY